MASKRLFKILGFVTFTCVSFLFFFYVTFPLGAIGQRLAQEIQRQTRGQISFTFSDVSWYRISGLSFDGVNVVMMQGQGDPMTLRFDNISARLRLFSSVFGKPSVSLHAEKEGGTLDAIIAKKGTKVSFEAEAKDVALSSLPLSHSWMGVSLQGKLFLDTHGELLFADNQRRRGASSPLQDISWDRSNMKTNIKFQGLGLGAGFLAGIEISDKIGFGNIRMSSELSKGRLELTSFVQQGGLVRIADASMHSNLRRTFSSSTLDVCFKVKVGDDAFLAKHPKIASLIELAQMQFMKDSDNFLHIKLGGLMRQLRMQRGICKPVRKFSAKKEDKKDK